MDITYSDHAEFDRMIRRGVSEADVQRVLGEGKAADAEPGSQKKVLRIRGRRIGVAYRQTGPGSYFVITVMVD